MKKYIGISLIIALLLIQSLSFAEDIKLLTKGEKIVILHDDYTWEYEKPITYDFDFSTIKDNKIPSFLRQGISANKATIITAVKMYLQGWRYTMPEPKSAQAAWGNYDGRTTWFYGYWHNIKIEAVSSSTPILKSNGRFVGDGQDQRNYYRNGGSPRWPTKIEWLLSESGGVEP